MTSMTLTIVTHCWNYYNQTR